MSFLMPQVQEVALSYMEALDCPRSLGIAILLRHGDLKQVVSLKSDPRHYLFAHDYHGATLATDFLRKLNVNVGIDRKAAALQKWWEAEKECYKTNSMILRLNAGIPFEGTYDSMMLSFLDCVRKNVEKLIGRAPPKVYSGRFGPGATVSDSSRVCTVPHKLCSQLTLTSKAIYHLVPFMGTAWGRLHASSGEWSFGAPLVVRGNKFFTVPKDAHTDRPCAKEPSLNAYFQLGIGQQLRSRLRERGIDLEHGQQVHRELAQRASQLIEDFATIDLSSASDCIARRFVEWVMPPAWFAELDALRSPFTEVEGKQVLLEKFSSMGNGFTFELETVLFCAICMATDPELRPGVNLFVYGDDILVPTGNAKNVIAALEICGFSTNKSKTFVDGPFRESCGGDFFNGTPVRGYYLKEEPSEPQDYIALANGLRRVLLQYGSADRFHSGLLRPWVCTLRHIPSSIRVLRGPVALGDAVIHDEPSAWTIRWKDGIRYIKGYLRESSPGIPLTRWHSDVVLSSILYGYRPDESHDGKRTVIPRDWGYSYRTGWLAFS